MHIDQRKEQFSRAYVQAVAAVAGYAHYTPSVDDDSIDCGLAARIASHLPRSPRLEMQIKCKEHARLTDPEVVYDLKLKNYDDLRGDSLVPRILVVVIVPEQIQDWLQHDEDALALHRCGYWLSLAGQPDTTNTTAVRVRIPRAQVFDVDGLHDLIQKVNDGVPL